MTFSQKYTSLAKYLNTIKCFGAAGAKTWKKLTSYDDIRFLKKKYVEAEKKHKSIYFDENYHLDDTHLDFVFLERG